MGRWAEVHCGNSPRTCRQAEIAAASSMRLRAAWRSASVASASMRSRVGRSVSPRPERLLEEAAGLPRQGGAALGSGQLGARCIDAPALRRAPPANVRGPVPAGLAPRGRPRVARDAAVMAGAAASGDAHRQRHGLPVALARRAAVARRRQRQLGIGGTASRRVPPLVQPQRIGPSPARAGCIAASVVVGSGSAAAVDAGSRFGGPGQRLEVLRGNCQRCIGLRCSGFIAATVPSAWRWSARASSPALARRATSAAMRRRCQAGRGRLRLTRRAASSTRPRERWRQGACRAAWRGSRVPPLRHRPARRCCGARRGNHSGTAMPTSSSRAPSFRVRRSVLWLASGPVARASRLRPRGAVPARRRATSSASPGPRAVEPRPPRKPLSFGVPNDDAGAARQGPGPTAGRDGQKRASRVCRTRIVVRVLGCIRCSSVEWGHGDRRAKATMRSCRPLRAIADELRQSASGADGVGEDQTRLADQASAPTEGVRAAPRWTALGASSARSGVDARRSRAQAPAKAACRRTAPTMTAIDVGGGRQRPSSASCTSAASASACRVWHGHGVRRGRRRHLTHGRNSQPPPPRTSVGRRTSSRMASQRRMDQE